MKDKETEEQTILHENGNKCVWMTSGVISFKLCPRDYKCEECMFDRVMRNESAAMVRRPKVDAALAADLSFIDSTSASRIDGSCFYHKNHCWIKVLKPDEVIIGINNILTRLIDNIKTIVAPKTGEHIACDQYFAHIIQEQYVVPLISPVNGSIMSINREITENPGIIKGENGSRKWLVSLRPDNLEKDLRTLYFGNSAIEWHKAMEKNVTEAIHAAYCVSGSDLGETMQDGGEFILTPPDMLSPAQYYKILEVISGPA